MVLVLAVSAASTLCLLLTLQQVRRLLLSQITER